MTPGTLKLIVLAVLVVAGGILVIRLFPYLLFILAVIGLVKVYQVLR